MTTNHNLNTLRVYILQSWRATLVALAVMTLAGGLALWPAGDTAQAQAESQWVHNFASSQDIEITAISVAPDNHVVIAGTFHGTVDFDPGPGEHLLTSGSSDSSFIARYGPAGNLFWANRMVGSGDVRINDVVVDPMSQIGVVGSFEGTADLDPSDGVFQVTSKGGHDIFLMRLYADGTMQWGWAAGDGDDDMGFAIATDSQSGYYITGKFEGRIYFQAGDSLTFEHSSVGGTDVFAARFNNAGSMHWVRTFGGPEDDNGTGIGVDGIRRVYVVGTFADIADIDPQWTSTEYRSHGRDDIFLSVITEIGNSLWQTYMGGPGNESNAQIVVEPDGSFYISGEFSQSANFNVRGEGGILQSRGLDDIFVTRFGSNRSYHWGFTLGAEQNDRLAALALDGFNNLYVLGNFGGTVDFDPLDAVSNLTSSGGSDIFLAKYNWVAQLQQAQNLHNPLDDRARDLAISSNGNVVIGGEYSGTLDLGNSLSISTGQPSGVYNGFVAHFARDTWTPLPQRAYLPGIVASTVTE